MIIPVGNSQVNLIFAGGSLPTGGQVTFGVDNSTGFTPAEIAEAVHGMWVDTLLGQQVTTTTLQSVLVKNGPNSTGPSATYTDPSSGSIGAAGDAPNTAYLITKHTAVGGRQGRGRMFVPGVPETEVDPGGQIGSVFLAGVQTEADDFHAALEAGDIPMILLRSEDSPPDPPRVVTSLAVSGLVATQRRRLRR